MALKIDSACGTAHTPSGVAFASGFAFGGRPRFFTGSTGAASPECGPRLSESVSEVGASCDGAAAALPSPFPCDFRLGFDALPFGGREGGGEPATGASAPGAGSNRDDAVVFAPFEADFPFSNFARTGLICAMAAGLDMVVTTCAGKTGK